MTTVTLQPARPEACPGYQLRRLRGKGPEGSVWEATTDDGAKVALKFMPCSDRQGVAQELRSLQIVTSFRHPNLDRAQRIWCQRNFVVVSMDYADGNLSDLLAIYQSDCDSCMGPADACFFLGQAAEALDYLNSRQHLVAGRRVGIQHCNVKPSNLLVFGETVRLSDFGLSTVTTGTTQPTWRGGTLPFAAPEVCQGMLSERTDQYALAVTWCLMRTGQLPFPELPAQFDPLYVRPQPDLSALTPAERPILARALSRSPHERWPSCREMIDKLNRSQK